MLPGLTSFAQELPGAGAQRDGWHLPLPSALVESPWGACWGILPHRPHTLEQTMCGRESLHRRHPSTQQGGDLAGTGRAGQDYHHRHVTVRAQHPFCSGQNANTVLAMAGSSPAPPQTKSCSPQACSSGRAQGHAPAACSAFLLLSLVKKGRVRLEVASAITSAPQPLSRVPHLASPSRQATRGALSHSSGAEHRQQLSPCVSGQQPITACQEGNLLPHGMSLSVRSFLLLVSTSFSCLKGST